MIDADPVQLPNDRLPGDRLPADRLPAFVRPEPRGRWRRLRPITRLAIALAESVAAFALGGWSGPAAILVIVLVTAGGVRALRRIAPFAAAAIPLLASIVLINTFLFPGAVDVIARIGPLTPTWTGLAVAGQAALRVLAFTLAIAVFTTTTATDELLDDLERAGIGRRLGFLVGSAIETIPRLLDRAREITEAQRARGLDTEGSLVARARGLVPLAGPLVLGSLARAEDQALALEARAFSAPGRRTPLRVRPELSGERLFRWALAVAAVLLVAAAIAGLVRLP